MSAMGHKQTFPVALEHVRYWPEADIVFGYRTLTGDDPVCLAPALFRMGKAREDLEWKVARNGAA